MTKKYIFGLCCMIIAGCSYAKASDIECTPVNGQMLLQTLVDTQGLAMPSSYRYINVLYQGVVTGTKSYDTLQQALYLGLVTNKITRINLTQSLTTKSTQRLIKKLFGVTISLSGNRRLCSSDLTSVFDSLLKTIQSPVISTSSDLSQEKLMEMFQDAYTKLRTNFIDSETITSAQLLQGAIKGMTESTKDPYTTYFPPTEAKDFMETIQGEFFGIGTHVEMKEPGKLLIVTPLHDSPAEEAGLLPGDQIIAIDGDPITISISLNNAVAKIKGPEGTAVILTILRGNQQFIKNITRKKIVIPPLTLKSLNTTTAYLSLAVFQFGLDTLFAEAVQDIHKQGYQNLIIDLRNNPGGSLEDVEHMLDYFVPGGSPSVIVKSHNQETPHYSLGVGSGLSLQHKRIIILINKGSASAAEIMAGVIKEYGTNVVTVGERTFGKGSVQSLRDYADGSSIKITTAKWLMGKTKSSIDKIGVLPDKEVIDDPKTPQDEILEYAQTL